MSTSFDLSRKTLLWAASSAARRSISVACRIGSTLRMRNGSMMVWNFTVVSCQVRFRGLSASARRNRSPTMTQNADLSQLPDVIASRSANPKKTRKTAALVPNPKLLIGVSLDVTGSMGRIDCNRCRVFSPIGAGENRSY